MSQAQHLELLKNKPKPKREAKPKATHYTGPVCANTLYTPETLQAAMPCGERYYNSLVKAGLPVRKIGGRHWISGRKVLEFMEIEENGQEKEGDREAG